MNLKVKMNNFIVSNDVIYRIKLVSKYFWKTWKEDKKRNGHKNILLLGLQSV